MQKPNSHRCRRYNYNIAGIKTQPVALWGNFCYNGISQKEIKLRAIKNELLYAINWTPTILLKCPATIRADKVPRKNKVANLSVFCTK